MVNLIWIGMILVGIVYSVLNGTTDKVNAAMFEASTQAVQLVIGFVAVFTFWLGMMEIAKQAGLLEKLTKLFRPFLIRLFPELSPKDPALGFIMSNMTANFFGLGNAATPFGLKAMSALQANNRDKAVPTRSMITFLCLNTAALTLFPTTVISLRMTNGALDPMDIVIPTFLATCSSCAIALTLDRLFYVFTSNRNRRP
ncbi:nucleoside recognition domain-containing protein [Jeotgalibacillus proteolyticus]|uniref:Spore maturation protein n=1 Tax=Jeotgalibacillus proteolyticus TaxID=2082395 RepID=A0A2S5GE30_9BACL|nr:nucleoside recognition domain-containing protein [Jeotgalibacillus proteolyticus]PPA71302.1 spore maturation protein [Jeotgalibacillus proteolyticus]